MYINNCVVFPSNEKDAYHSEVRMRPFCGGTLLSSDTVLTSNQCKKSLSKFKVVVGALAPHSNPSRSVYIV